MKRKAKIWRDAYCWCYEVPLQGGATLMCSTTSWRRALARVAFHMRAYAEGY